MTATSEQTASDNLNAAAQDIDNCLTKTFTALPVTLKRKYQLSGNDVLVAIALGTTSNAATAIAAATGCTIADGWALREELRGVIINWLDQHSEKP